MAEKQTFLVDLGGGSSILLGPTCSKPNKTRYMQSRSYHDASMRHTAGSASCHVRMRVLQRGPCIGVRQEKSLSANLRSSAGLLCVMDAAIVILLRQIPPPSETPKGLKGLYPVITINIPQSPEYHPCFLFQVFSCCAPTHSRPWGLCIGLHFLFHSKSFFFWVGGGVGWGLELLKPRTRQGQKKKGGLHLYRVVRRTLQ